MAPEILQLLLLLLLPSLGISGKPRRSVVQLPGSGRQDVQTEKAHKLEGETFSANCSYTLQENKTIWISWCKMQENREDCNIVPLETRSSFKVADRIYLSSADVNSGIVTIMMSGLRENDSGFYKCGILSNSPENEVIRRFHLQVSPAQTQSPRNRIQANSEDTSNNTNSSSEKKFIILGVVLSCLLLLVLLLVGIICARRIYQRAEKGDDSETQGEKLKGSNMKMDSNEDAKDIHYATVSKRSHRELINVQTHTPVETVQYATITKNRHQLPKSIPHQDPV
ncbi:trem-like transcript 4 protein [Monodelphis domestica]|uniref:trem-like transcript 4 protein n=1 Tax=Monodelphis domestica TaxID=13616 RepID=UPI00005EB177|nr:trem-like transcript 4 protein [Monodelphis domestica]XP_056674179.1 trem-like transcript 4 protein [Monodelphis domestica]